MGLSKIRMAGFALFGAGLAIGLLGGVAGSELWRRHQDRLVWNRESANPQARALYRHRLDQFALLPGGQAVVVLGDSISREGEWTELLGLPVANRAIGGETSASLLARLDRSVPISARTVLLMIGSNDFKRGDVTAETVAGNIETIVGGLPGRRVFVQSVLPRNASSGANARIERLNAQLRAFCARGTCTYIDLRPNLAPKGLLAAGDSFDGVHLSGPAMRRWADQIRPLVAIPAG